MKFSRLLPLLTGLVLLAAPPKSGVDKAAIDPTCMPCDDFWRYANGSWIDKNPIPAKSAGWGSFLVLRDQNAERLKGILDEAAQKPTPKTAKIGAFYAACLDTEALDRKGFSPVEPMLKRVNQIDSPAGVAAEIMAMVRLGLSAPLDVSTGADYKNSTEIILGVDIGGLSLPDRDFYVNTDARSQRVRTEFLKYSARLLELTGIPAEQATQRAETILAFETKLAEARMKRADLRNRDNTYNKTDQAGLKVMVPGISWGALIDSEGLKQTIPVNVRDMGALKAFGQRLADTPVDTWKAYLHWRWLSASADKLSKPFRDQQFAFNRTVLAGVKEMEPRWQTCSAQTDAVLGEELGQVFVAKYFPPAAKARMRTLVENLRETLREELPTVPFMGPATQKAALEKLNAFFPKVGYPDKWRDYSALEVKRDDVFANFLAARAFSHREAMSRAGKPVDRSRWGMTPPTVNAYYNASLNEIVFPAGILQPPFFDLEADDAANYGAIGAVIGHEMGHGFDDQGSKFDAQGNMRDWWTAEDRKKFDERAACIIDQFDTIDVGDGLRHNGRLVTGEAMGDVGGLTLAYKAYKRSLKGKPGPVIDGFTADQRFFLAFARVWGSYERPESRQLRLKTDPHPISKWRANGTLSNMPEFFAAFSCKRGDPMVRPEEKRCKLW
ncbi:MAG: M13 family metallopeptidase [Acidobacteria bacterium]|nr:M13 family metallopeptidase [Acidobacteriota bacterium]